MSTIPERDLARGELGIGYLATTIKVSEKDVIEILRLGLEATSSTPGKLNKRKQFFINEMVKSFADE